MSFNIPKSVGTYTANISLQSLYIQGQNYVPGLNYDPSLIGNQIFQIVPHNTILGAYTGNAYVYSDAYLNITFSGTVPAFIGTGWLPGDNPAPPYSVFNGTATIIVLQELPSNYTAPIFDFATALYFSTNAGLEIFAGPEQSFYFTNNQSCTLTVSANASGISPSTENTPYLGGATAQAGGSYVAPLTFTWTLTNNQSTPPVNLGQSDNLSLGDSAISWQDLTGTQAHPTTTTATILVTDSASPPCMATATASYTVSLRSSSSSGSSSRSSSSLSSSSRSSSSRNSSRSSSRGSSSSSSSSSLSALVGPSPQPGPNPIC